VFDLSLRASYFLTNGFSVWFELKEEQDYSSYVTGACSEFTHDSIDTGVFSYRVSIC